MPLQRNHRIHAAVVVLVADDTHGTEDTAETIGADPLHQAGVDAVQVLVDVGRAEHLCHLALTGQAVVAEEELLHGLVATVTAVAALDVAHLIGIEPVALALGKQVKALGIELAVVDGVFTSIISRMSRQRKRRLPLSSVSRAWLLLVPMNEAMRGSVVLCLA